MNIILRLEWNLALAAGVITLSMGHTQNREYAELIWPIDLGVLLVLALIFYDLFQTLRQRQENLLYVSVWYVIGAVIFTFFSYFFGNAVWNPDTGSITGMPDAILSWFYGSTSWVSSSPRCPWPWPITSFPSSAGPPFTAIPYP